MLWALSCLFYRCRCLKVAGRQLLQFGCDAGAVRDSFPRPGPAYAYSRLNHCVRVSCEVDVRFQSRVAVRALPAAIRYGVIQGISTLSEDDRAKAIAASDVSGSHLSESIDGQRDGREMAVLANAVRTSGRISGSMLNHVEVRLGGRVALFAAIIAPAPVADRQSGA